MAHPEHGLSMRHTQTPLLFRERRTSKKKFLKSFFLSKTLIGCVVNSLIEMTKILVSYPLPGKYFKKLENIEGVNAIKTTEEDRIREEIKDADVLFDKELNSELFNKAIQLDWIQSPYVGVDMLLIDELIDSDVTVTCARGIHSSQVSDHVFAYILSFAREIPHFLENKRNKIWEQRHPFPFKPLIELKKKKLGVIGLGTIGKEVARKGKCFNMDVLGVKKHREEIEFVDELYTKNKTGVIEKSDFLVLCVPYTPETKKMIGERELRKMKKDSYLINVSRGEVIEQDALFRALNEEWIKGAAIDVAEEEPLPEYSPLWELDNLLITPHVAGSTPDYWERVYDVFVENIERYQEGKELINKVDKKKGY